VTSSLGKTLQMHINTINGKHLVEFDQGKFDKWCVYLKRQHQGRYAPGDEEYFIFFKRLAVKHGSAKVYNDFIEIYHATTKQYSQAVVERIKQISQEYDDDAEDAEIWFSVIYGGMIAEENKEGMILKKRIKRLGMHQVLLENYAPALASKFSVGKQWKDLNTLMRERGFGI
jgi:hypothetical protein